MFFFNKAFRNLKRMQAVLELTSCGGLEQLTTLLQVRAVYMPSVADCCVYVSHVCLCTVCMRRGLVNAVQLSSVLCVGGLGMC